MTVEIRPMGIQCNLRCEYCYQNHERDNGTGAKGFDNFDEIKDMIDSDFVLFGGEALLTPLNKLEELFKHGYEEYGSTGIQTNGTLITDEHIELFKKYRVHVGFSIDGKEELNDLRWAGSLEKTRKLTKKSNENIKKLQEAGVSSSIIITLHKQNASKEKIPKMKEWLWELNETGIKSLRFHVLEKEGNDGDNYALTNEENFYAFNELMDLNSNPDFKIQIDVYNDIIKLLKGKDNRTTCTFNACDPYVTSSVADISTNGVNGCGRPHKDGFEWNKGKTPSYIRELSLYHTPQEYGGCKGCEYFIVCKGHCAGTGINGDWRNRSEYCELHKKMFEQYEKKLEEVNEVPITKHPMKDEIEKIMIEGYENGYAKKIETIMREIRGGHNQNNKSCNASKPKRTREHLDSPHIDSINHSDHSDNKGVV